jgi:hypothetical protein
MNQFTPALIRSGSLWLAAFILLPSACARAIGPDAAAVEQWATMLQRVNTERLLPGRFEFRELEGWMVRFDTAKGTYCAMENISDAHFIVNVRQFGQKTAEQSLPGGGMCKD